MTRAAFIEALHKIIATRHAWASDTEKLQRFMQSVYATLSNDGAGPYYDHTGDATKAAWQAIGGKGRPSLKSLRALP